MGKLIFLEFKSERKLLPSNIKKFLSKSSHAKSKEPGVAKAKNDSIALLSQR